MRSMIIFMIYPHRKKQKKYLYTLYTHYIKTMSKYLYSKQLPPLLSIILSFNLQKEILLHEPRMNPLADSLRERIVIHIRGNHHTFIGRQAFVKQHIQHIHN